MSAKTFKEECEMHWQVPVTIFPEYIKSFFLSNVFISEFSIQLRQDCEDCIWCFHYLLHHLLSNRAHRGHGVPGCQWPMKQWLFVLQHHLWAISCCDLQWTPVPTVATGCVAACEPCCPPPYYSCEFCKQQICDEVPSSVVTSSFISVARAVWHRDAFF